MKKPKEINIQNTILKLTNTIDEFENGYGDAPTKLRIDFAYDCLAAIKKLQEDYRELQKKITDHMDNEIDWLTSAINKMGVIQNDRCNIHL